MNLAVYIYKIMFDRKFEGKFGVLYKQRKKVSYLLKIGCYFCISRYLNY